MTFDDVRPSVKWFAMLMEETLRKHDDTKGGWHECDSRWLYERLLEEAEELRREIDNDADCMVISINRVVAEAVDVANFAMMIADNHRDGRRYIESIRGR